MVKGSDPCRRLMTIPGVGQLTTLAAPDLGAPRPEAPDRPERLDRDDLDDYDDYDDSLPGPIDEVVARVPPAWPRRRARS